MAFGAIGIGAARCGVRGGPGFFRYFAKDLPPSAGGPRLSPYPKVYTLRDCTNSPVEYVLNEYRPLTLDGPTMHSDLDGFC